VKRELSRLKEKSGEKREEKEEKQGRNAKQYKKRFEAKQKVVFS
jgi:hypothetical protein